MTSFRSVVDVQSCGARIDNRDRHEGWCRDTGCAAGREHSLGIPDQSPEESKMTMSDEYYRELENGMRLLLDSTRDAVLASDVTQVESFLDHAEYGEALVLLCGAIVESSVSIHGAVVVAIRGLGSTMGILDDLPNGPWAEDPRDRHASGRRPL